VALSLAVPAVLHAPAEPLPVRAPAAVDTSSRLAPSDSGYADAVAFARFLEGRGCGFHVQSIGRSKSSGFLGEWRSASYRTDHGNFAVVFFPPPDGAERVRITSEVRGGHYFYTFRTHQSGLRRVQKEDHDAPQRFVVHGRWFIFVWDGNTEWALRNALAPPDTANRPAQP
jgi:hypothetical protein